MKSKNCARQILISKSAPGLELDNDPETSAAGRKWVEQHWDKLDFVLGSVHYLERDDQMFDSVPAGAEQFTGRDIDQVYSDYFRRVREVAATGLVDCLSHLDLIKIHGHRPKAKVEGLVEETLDFIASRGLCIELSTAGWRKPVNELYPSDEIIRLAMAKGIRFTTASDAHSHVQLGENYDRLAEKMEKLGIREVCVYEKHRPQVVIPSARCPVGHGASPAVPWALDNHGSQVPRLQPQPRHPEPAGNLRHLRLRELFALRDGLRDAAQDRCLEELYVFGIDDLLRDLNRDHIARTIRHDRDLSAGRLHFDRFVFELGLRFRHLLLHLLGLLH